MGSGQRRALFRLRGLYPVFQEGDGAGQSPGPLHCSFQPQSSARTRPSPGLGPSPAPPALPSWFPTCTLPTLSGSLGQTAINQAGDTWGSPCTFPRSSALLRPPLCLPTLCWAQGSQVPGGPWQSPP